MDFTEFPKIPRLSRDCTITEKIDGTNGVISIRHAEPWQDADGIKTHMPLPFEFGLDCQCRAAGVEVYIRAGSRTRWLEHSGKGDNFGFGNWVMNHAHELAALGVGSHYGEWWGLGIQRGYGQTRKRFSLFNTSRWVPAHESYVNTVGGSTTEFMGTELREGQGYVPLCCDVAPVLYEGLFDTYRVNQALQVLTFGSAAAPGFTQPEGVMVFHHASHSYFKKTLLNDEAPKGKA